MIGEEIQQDTHMLRITVARLTFSRRAVARIEPSRATCAQYLGSFQPIGWLCIIAE
jgi:hypothetical protein